MEKNILQRHLKDLFSKERFAHDKSSDRLPVLIKKHNSLIRRRLGNVDMQLQENKAVNLSIAAPCVNGIIIRPGETFSFWRLVGRDTKRRGFKEGLAIARGCPTKRKGGGMCQFTNLLHWMALHSDLTVAERHHHDDYDLFPDFGRQVPFGVGTSILYNYLDYRLYNGTPDTWQILVRSDGEYLRGELRCSTQPDHVWHICCEEEYFSRENGVWYRNNRVIRRCVDRATGNERSRELLQAPHARVCYDEQYIDPKKIR